MVDSCNSSYVSKKLEPILLKVQSVFKMPKGKKNVLLEEQLKKRMQQEKPFIANFEKKLEDSRV